MSKFLNSFLTKYLTITRGSAKISQTSEIGTSPIREMGETKNL